MNPKHLAANFNINAILDKSAPERKSYLDKMLDDKANAEKILEKHKNYLSQERIEELMETLQVLEAKIEQVTKSLPPVEPRKVLEQIGDTYDAQFENGTKTSFAVVTAQGLESLLGREELLRVINASKTGSSNTNKTYDDYSDSNKTGIVKNGYIVNIDLYQQVAILGVIEKKAGLYNRIGFYNLNGSMCVHQTDAAKLWKAKQISWFWTGEIFNESFNRRDYKKEGIIYINDNDLLDNLKENSQFFSRSINDSMCHNYSPDDVFGPEVFLIGLILPPADLP